MVAILNEKLFPLRSAVNLVPSGQAGKKLSIGTLFRWAMRGVRGVKLETVLIGNSRLTSREAIERFSTTLSARPDDQAAVATPSTPVRSRKAHEKADGKLAAAGW